MLLLLLHCFYVKFVYLFVRFLSISFLNEKVSQGGFCLWMTVMFMGAIVYGVRYTIPEYLCTFLVAGGVSVFALFKVIMAI